MEGQVIINDLEIIWSMVLEHRGVALLPTYICRAEMATGRLVRLIPEWYASADPVHLVYPGQRFVAPKVRAFMTIAETMLRKCLD